MLSLKRENPHHSCERPKRVRIGATFALFLGGAISIGPAEADYGAAAGTQWTTAGGTPQGTRFSALTQINSNNVSKLIKEYAVKTEVGGRFMGEPLVVGKMMYAVTGYPNMLIAYDLSNKGEIKWQFAPDVNEYSKGANCCGGINRGAAYDDGKDANGVQTQPPKIVFNLLDNTVVAVNASTGKLIWRKNLADPHTGLTMTVAPVIVPGKEDGVKKVITASSSGEMGVRGWIQALDLQTGTPLWRAYNTGPDNDVMIKPEFYNQSKYYKESNLGETSWDSDRSWLLGGSSAWGYLSYDPDTNQLFYGTSQPGVWNADMRPGENKWGSSIFARNADTGYANWAYQVTPHDSWDYDAASENIAVDQAVTKDGIEHDQILVHLNKNGFAYTIDRKSGEVLKANQFVDHVNWVERDNSGNPVLDEFGLPVIQEAMRIRQDSPSKTKVCPSVLGGKGWEPGAFSRTTGLFYMPTFNFCSNLDALKAEFISGAPYMGADYDISLDLSALVDGKYYPSDLIAWDAVNGVRKWRVREEAMIYAGVLATDGNLVFYTTQNPPMLKAVDATTGAPKWSTSLTCNTVGNPISFQGPDGKQRIAVFSDNACSGGSGRGVVNVFKLGR